MKKVFNTYKIDEVISELKRFGINITDKDIYKNKALKKIRKDLNKIDYVKAVWNYSPSNEMLKRFFPVKYEEVSSGEFRTTKVFYNHDDCKLHWSVVHNGNERFFKLATDCYEPRAREEIKNTYKIIKKKIDNLYGYWYVDGYVTDLNKENGKYKIIYKDNYLYNKKFANSRDEINLKVMD